MPVCCWRPNICGCCGNEYVGGYCWLWLWLAADEEVDSTNACDEYESADNQQIALTNTEHRGIMVNE